MALYRQCHKEEHANEGNQPGKIVRTLATAEERDVHQVGLPRAPQDRCGLPAFQAQRWLRGLAPAPMPAIPPQIHVRIRSAHGDEAGEGWFSHSRLLLPGHQAIPAHTAQSPSREYRARRPVLAEKSGGVVPDRAVSRAASSRKAACSACRRRDAPLKERHTSSSACGAK